MEGGGEETRVAGMGGGTVRGGFVKDGNWHRPGISSSLHDLSFVTALSKQTTPHVHWFKKRVELKDFHSNSQFSVIK